jgi:hypothetical protein
VSHGPKLIAQIVVFVLPNIQIYDTHVVDLYEWVCARYPVGVKVQIQKQARSEFCTRVNFRTDHAGFYPKVGSGDQLSKREYIYIFQYEMAERESVNPH